MHGGHCPVPAEALDEAFFDYVFDLRADIAPEHEAHAELMKKLR